MHPPATIGTAAIFPWLAAHEPGVTLPSTALVQLALTKCTHRIRKEEDLTTTVAEDLRRG
jgi:hypothetical protein